VLVDGDLTVTGAKGAVVPHPDGSRRLLCAIESPERFKKIGVAPDPQDHPQTPAVE